MAVLRKVARASSGVQTIGSSLSLNDVLTTIGTPVIASRVSSLPDVTGSAAMLVNPENVFDIARGITEVLLNAELREELISRGRKQAARFSWRRTAEEVLDVYEQLGPRGADN